MANEITINAFIRVRNGAFQHSSDVGQVSLDQATGSGGNPGVISVTTTAATISFGSVTPGYVWVRNLSTSSSCLVQSTGGVSLGDFAPQQLGLWPKGSAAWQLKASTAGGTPLVDVRGYST